MALPRLIFLLLILLLTMMITTSATNMSKPGCPSHCGNVPIPYPFGIGSGCYLDKEFEIICYMNISTISNATVNNGNSSSVVRETPYLGLIGQKVFDVSLEQVRVTAWSSIVCFNKSGKIAASVAAANYSFDISNSPFTFSKTRNNFTGIGCDIFAYISNVSGPKKPIAGCASLCYEFGNFDVTNGSCSGIGCCQTPIPSGLNAFDIHAYSINTNNQVWLDDSESCSFVSLHDDYLFDNFNNSFVRFNYSSAIAISSLSSTRSSVLDWAIGEHTCEEARRRGNYECQKNSECINSSNGPGYKCRCSPGFEGNPYLPHGCQDIDECSTRQGLCQAEARCINTTPGFEGNPYLPNGCQDIDECISTPTACQAGAHCINTPGSYHCECPIGTYGDGRKHGIGCIRLGPDPKRPMVVVVSLGIGVGLGLLLLLAIGFWIYRAMKRRNQIKLKQKFFKRNGGLLLEQQISSGGDGNVERTKIFVTEELERATDSFNESRILGRGGSGTVYKGMLSDGRIVAIKKSKIIDESQIGQFINELVILSQINHRNIVRLLGCCLETDVPLLVYEYVSNGTLSHHLYNEAHFASMSWKDRLRISREVAGALSYLHSSASVPIFHRDIKSSNILLDENFRVKVSDFGISRSVPFEKTHLTTLVQGTFGYLDPEYFHSGQFTDKSDVYSFGVVLVELLTGEKPISYTRTENEKNLSMHFISAVKEGRLLQVLEKRVVNEGDKQDLLIVAKLAKRCLKLVGKKRPTMKEVAAELEGLRSCQDQPYSLPNCEDNSHCSLEAEQLSVCISSGPNSQNSDL